MSAVKGQPRKRLTPDERESIIELKLQRVPVRQIADRLDCSPTTVQTVWSAYLKERSSSRKKAADLTLEEQLARLEQAAVDARRGHQRAVRAEDSKGAVAFINAEVRAITELTKLGAVRELEPEQAARISAAQTSQLSGAVLRVLSGLDLTAGQKAKAAELLASEMETLAASAQPS